MKYLDYKIKRVTEKMLSYCVSTGMIIRIILLLFLLILGRFFCEWATEKSYNYDKRQVIYYGK